MRRWRRASEAEQEGLVSRRPGTDHARSVLVSLTEAGHELVEATVDQVLSREAGLVDGLDAEQQRQLVRLLELLLVSTNQRL